MAVNPCLHAPALDRTEPGIRLSSGGNTTPSGVNLLPWKPSVPLPWQSPSLPSWRGGEAWSCHRPECLGLPLLLLEVELFSKQTYFRLLCTLFWEEDLPTSSQPEISLFYLCWTFFFFSHFFFGFFRNDVNGRQIGSLCLVIYCCLFIWSSSCLSPPGAFLVGLWCHWFCFLVDSITLVLFSAMHLLICDATEMGFAGYCSISFFTHLLCPCYLPFYINLASQFTLFSSFFLNFVKLFSLCFWK